MFALKSVVRSAAVAVALAAIAVPSVAFASPKGDRNGEHAEHEKHFPMKADRFREHLEKRIAKAKAHLEKQLDAHKVDAAMRTRIEKEFDAGAAQVRAAAAKAEADGTVTADEAKDVRDLAKRLRKEAKKRLEKK